MVTLRQLTSHDILAELSPLAEILVDCVAGGASVNFMAGFSQADGEAFFRRIADDVAAGRRLVWVADLEGRPVGSVQIILDTPPNQPHRAEVSKMIVHRSARRLGIGRMLMEAAEAGAKAAGRSILTLDTVQGEPSEWLYQKCGWTAAGVIPDYALRPTGELCSTVYYFKRI